MEPLSTRILVVDDEPFILEIISEHLEGEAFVPVCTESAEDAWAILTNDHDFGAILLDWMMPGMDGLELLRMIKQHDAVKSIPVIMQTARADKASIDAGFQAGAYYYLNKPFNKPTLLPIVRAAIDTQPVIESPASTRLHDDTAIGDYNLRSIQTLDQAKNLILELTNAYPDNPEMAMGLSELLINAIEHGNLGISYEEKRHLVQADTWQEEVNRRLQLDEHRHKRVTLSVMKTENQLQIVIRDEGPGFDWQDYLDFSADRAFDPHGRGIAMANLMSFDSIQYQGKGNEVIATIKL